MPKLQPKFIVLFAACGLTAIAALAVWRIQYARSHNAFQTAIVRNPYGGANSVDKVEFSPDGRDLVLEDIAASLSVWNIQNRRWTFWLEHGAESKDDHVPLVARPFLNDHIVKIPGFPPPLPNYPSHYPFDLEVGDHSENIDIIAPSGSVRAYLRADNLVSVADTRHKRILFSTSPSKSESGGQQFQQYLDKPCAIAFSPDEKILAMASIHTRDSDPQASWRPQTQITLFNVQNGAVVQHWTWDKFQTTPIGNLGANIKTMALAFSPDGQRLAISDDAQISLWNVHSASLIRSITSDSDTRWVMTKQLIFFHKRPFIAGSGWGDKIYIWNVTSGRLVQTFYGTMNTDIIALSPDNRLLASTGQDEKGQAVLKVWDVSKL